MSDQVPEIPQGLENDGPPDHSEYIPPAPSPEPQAQDNQNNVPETQRSAGTGDNDSDSDNSDIKFNPAWNSLLDKIPTPFHKEVAPFLKKWDSDYNSVQSQFAPYKPLIEQGVTPDSIQNSLRLAQMIQANPRAIYDELGQRFGFATPSGQGQEVDEDDEEDENTDGIENPLDNPALAPYIERQQQMEQYLAEQERHRYEQELDREIQNEWNQIEKNHGSPIPQEIKAEMVRRSLWVADQKGDGYEPKLIDGYNDYNNWVNRVRAQKANNSAPEVFNGTGGVPSTPNGITADMTQEQRVAYIAERAKALNSND